MPAREEGELDLNTPQHIIHKSFKTTFCPALCKFSFLRHIQTQECPLLFQMQNAP